MQTRSDRRAHARPLLRPATPIGFPLGFGPVGLWAGIACVLARVSVMTSLRFLRRSRVSPEPIERIV